MKGSCLCCGLQRDIAARAVAIADVAFGAVAFIITFVHVKQMYDGSEQLCCKINVFYPQRYGRYSHNQQGNGNEATMPTWLPIVILVSTGVQCVMGIALYAAAVTINRRICQLWFFTTGATCLFTFFLLRIYQILVVSEFVHELDREHRQDAGVVRSGEIIAGPITPQQVPMQQLRVTIPKPETDFIGGRNYDNNTSGFMYQYHHQQQNHYTISCTSPSAVPVPVTSSLYVPPTPPSYVPTQVEEDAPPPYHIAIGCPPAKLH